MIRLRVSNDDKEMIGMSDSKVNGDDAGNTHGLGLNVSCSSEDGISKTFSFDSDLYTNPELDADGKYIRDSERRAKQKFRSFIAGEPAAMVS